MSMSTTVYSSQIYHDGAILEDYLLMQDEGVSELKRKMEELKTQNSILRTEVTLLNRTLLNLGQLIYHLYSGSLESLSADWRNGALVIDGKISSSTSEPT